MKYHCLFIKMSRINEFESQVDPADESKNRTKRASWILMPVTVHLCFLKEYSGSLHRMHICQHETVQLLSLITMVGYK